MGSPLDRGPATSLLKGRSGRCADSVRDVARAHTTRRAAVVIAGCEAAALRRRANRGPLRRWVWGEYVALRGPPGHSSSWTGHRRAGPRNIQLVPDPRRSPASGGRANPSGASSSLSGLNSSCANNAGSEAVNGLIELNRRVARGVCNRDNYASGCSSSAAGCGF